MSKPSAARRGPQGRGLPRTNKGPIHGCGDQKPDHAKACTAPALFPTKPATAVEIPGPHDRWGLYPGEPEACRRQVLPFLRTMVQLGLLVVLFKRFQIEGRAFLAIATLALFALPVHYLAPYRWKKPLFVAVSMVGLFWVFGTEVGSVVLGLAALLLGICFLPVSWHAAGGLPCRGGRGACLRGARHSSPSSLPPSGRFLQRCSCSAFSSTCMS